MGMDVGILVRDVRKLRDLSLAGVYYLCEVGSKVLYFT